MNNRWVVRKFVVVSLVIMGCMGVMSGCSKKEAVSTEASSEAEAKADVRPETEAETQTEESKKNVRPVVTQAEVSAETAAETAPAEPEETPAAQTEAPATEVSAEPTTAPAAQSSLPGTFPMTFYFTSGAGGWGTTMYLNADGSFTGEYHDSDMGVTGDGYPGGTMDVCDFSGRFGNIQQVDGNTYSMSLDEITTQQVEGEQWIEDGILKIASGPHGLEGGTDFLYYLPGTSTAGLSEDFMSWIRGIYMDAEASGSLPCYGIYNQQMGYAFFS